MKSLKFRSTDCRVLCRTLPLSPQGVYGDFVPLITLGGLPLVGALLVLPLPETRDCVLPDSLQDGENFCSSRAKEDMRNANYIQVPPKEVMREDA